MAAPMIDLAARTDRVVLGQSARYDGGSKIFQPGHAEEGVGDAAQRFEHRL
jgi:hypothetical protein